MFQKDILGLKDGKNQANGWTFRVCLQKRRISES